MLEYQAKLRRGREYVFFDPEKADKAHGRVDELVLTTDDMERNSVYVVFSPKPFARALDNHTADDIPRSLSRDDFARWLAKSRRNDPKMGVRIMNIEITK